MLQTRLILIFFFGVVRCAESQVYVNIYKHDIGYDDRVSFVYNTIENGNFKAENDYLSKLADSGKITYENAKKRLSQHKEYWLANRDAVTLNINDNISLAYSVHNRDYPGYPVPEYYYDIDGNTIKFERPSDLLKFFVFQNDIKQRYLDYEIRSIVGETYTDNINNRCLISLFRETPLLEQKKIMINEREVLVTTKRIRTRKIKFLIRPFPYFNHELLLDKSFYIKEKEPDYEHKTIRDYKEYSLKYIKFLNNNSFLDLSREIRKLEKEINVQNQEHPDG